MNKQSRLFPEENEIYTLTEKLLRYQHEYYVLNKPSISDKKYDELFDRLVYLEKLFPQINNKYSPLKRVGSDLASDLPEVRHSIPVLSLDKVYNSSALLDWISRIEKATGKKQVFIIEEKIDGISIVLYYRKGILEKAVTRGNGITGNDVTDNVKTIGAVPLKLSREIDIAARGEIYLPVNLFNTLNAKLGNIYANPRNLAAGTIRRIKSSEVKKIPLNIYMYEGFSQEKVYLSHADILRDLEDLGFRVNKKIKAFTDNIEELQRIKDLIDTHLLKDIDGYLSQVTEERNFLHYEIDGLVVKIDNISERESLGFTGHHPKWAVAYKFASSEAESTIISIDVQIGRTGRATPLARIKPVLISGSTISNVTLHNQDYIDFLCVSPGDRVTVSKRGDVIPAIENVIDKNTSDNNTWKMPENCPVCDTLLIKDGAHLFCRNIRCRARIKGQLLFFASREQMNIDNLGSETIDLLVENKIIENIADLYSVDFSVLEKHEGFGFKKIELIENSIEKSKSMPFKTVLSSLGFPELGPRVCEYLINSGIESIDMLFEIIEKSEKDKLLSINGIGEKTVESIFRHLSDKENIKLIMRLKESGLQFRVDKEDRNKTIDNSFANQIWCVTGTFENFKPRTLAEKEITMRGGSVTSQVTGKTSHLLCGESPGSKLEKAKNLGTALINENEFIQMIKNSK